MAILPGVLQGTGLLTDQSDPTGSNLYGGGLLGGGMYSNPLLNFGMGLLSQTGPSREPQGGFGAIGKAFSYASQAQQEALQNQLRRQAIIQQQQELQGTAKIQKLFQDDPTILNDPPRMLAALAAAAPKELASGLAGVYADPLRPIKEQLATDQATAAAAATADTKIKNNAQWQNSYAAAKAAEYLQSQKGGELLARSPNLTSIIRGGSSVVAAVGGDPAEAIKLFPFLKDVDAKEIPKMLEAADTLATRGHLLTPLTGDLSSSSLGTQLDAYRQVQQGAEDVAKADKRLALPEPPKFAWAAPPPPATATAAATPPPPAPPPAGGGSLSWNPQQGVVRSPASQTVYGDLPPAAPAAAPSPPPPAAAPGADVFGKIGNAYQKGWNAIFGAPTPEAAPAPLTPPVPAQAPAAAPQAPPRKVATVRYDPQGRALFRSEAEVHRAIKNKWIALPPAGQTTMIVINGQLYPLTNTGVPEGG